MLAADVVIIADAGNFAAGVPTVTTSLRGIANVTVSVSTLDSAMHSGMFGGPAPDALIALTRMLASLHDERGNTAIRGLASNQGFGGIEYPEQQFRADAHLLDGVSVIGDGSISEMLWARPSVSVLGIDCPPALGSTAALAPHARARVSLRVPPGMGPRQGAGCAGGPPGIRRAVEGQGSDRARSGGRAIPGAHRWSRL